jgi:hypothetical protein
VIRPQPNDSALVTEMAVWQHRAMKAWVLIAAVACSTAKGGDPSPANVAPTTSTHELVASLRSATIRVATYRPPNSQLATLERKVTIIGPDEAKRLEAVGDPAILDELLPLLDDPERAWAANVLLAKLTQSDEKTVDIYAAQPDRWWQTFGPHARQSWQRFLDEHRGLLVWNSGMAVYDVKSR